MSEQMILVCRLVDEGYFSKWINNRRVMGSYKPYFALFNRRDNEWAQEDKLDNLDFPVLCGPLYKWREE